MTDSPSNFPVVGIGASAGGLESLERLFRALPPRPGLAFVVVQHLSPDFKSLMDELMSRFTELPVRLAAEDQTLECNTVTLLPPGKELEIRGGKLKLYDRDPGLTLPIDRFLGSLADDMAERAVAVILSGSGTDGSRGAKRVHDVGGLVLVEDPDLARFDGMPRAALDAGVADLSMSADAIAGALVERAGETDDTPPAQGETVNQIIGLLRTSLGIDFAQYKMPTIQRRLRRRLGLQHVSDLEAYLELLRRDPAELDALGHDLLIGVTAFFRDPAIWEVLETQVFPRLGASPERPLRAWVAGCATGEEAYTVAMCLLEAAGNGQVKVFATDVHRKALELASVGIYAADRLADLSDERRRRFFVQRSDGRYQVAQELRHAVVFAHHNVLKDAPFTQLDLVTCRNLLIYFRPSAQRHALQLMQYGLKNGGTLLLGPSENLGDLAQDFTAIDESHRIFTKLRSPHRLPELSMSRQVAVMPKAPRSPDNQLLGLYDAVLDRVMPPSVLVDGDRTLIDCFGGAEKYLKVGSRRASSDVLDMLPEGLRVPVAGLLSRASREAQTVWLEGLAWPQGDGSVRVDVGVDAINGNHRPRAFLLTFKPETQAKEPPLVAPDPRVLTDERFRALELELRQSKESLRATLEELDTSAEEMQATNEELVASNEELQSTNEELHSVNEELHTVNAELQSKIRELSELNNDMRRLFESIDATIVFLDAKLCIRRFTPSAARMFGLLEQDVGRPLGSFHHPLERSTLIDDLARCRDEGKTLEYDTTDVHGRSYLVRIHPGRAGATEGVVLTLTDLTAITAARQRAELLSFIVSSSADAIIGLDQERKITAWNPAAVRLYGYSEAEAVGMPVERLVPASQLEQLRESLERVWRGEVATLDTVRHHRDGTAIDVSTTISPVRGRDGRVIGASKVDRDIRDRKARETQLAEAARLRERFLALVSHELRTPVHAARTATEIISTAGNQETTKQRALGVLQRQTAQMTRLLDDLLDVARITQDRFQLSRVPLDLREPVRAAIDAGVMGSGLPPGRVDFRASPEPLPMLGDPARLQQVVANLLSNAVRHSPDDSCVEVVLERRGDRAIIQVRDCGEGLSPGGLSMIFQLFSKSEDYRGSGLGLGLAVARGIVEGHGGTISAASEGPGRGACFTVELPLAQVQPESPAPGPGRAFRLVLVEDQPDSRDMATLLLEAHGHSVVAAASGQGGIDAILNELPEVALVDIGLPDMTGYEVARTVRARIGAKVRLIALTGYGQPEDVRRCLDAGFDRHLTKPLDSHVLERAIAELAAREAQ